MKATIEFEVEARDGLSRANARRALLRYAGKLDENAEHEMDALGVRIERVLKVELDTTASLPHHRRGDQHH